MASEFEKGYSLLNKAQKQAVDTIDGPLLVIAGPGTGKTQLLSLRVANILNKTDVVDQNILCLTFTESAVNEMRDRLNKIIGPSAYKITINTYHGFGSDLIGQYPHYFSGVSNLEPAGELLINKVLNEITSALPLSSSFKNSQNLSGIKSLISDFKKATLYPKDIKTIISDNLAFIDRHSKITTKLTPFVARVSKKAIPFFYKLLTKEQSNKTFESLESAWNRELTSALEQVNEEKDNKALSAWKLKFLAKDEAVNSIVAGKAQNDRLLDFVQIYDAYINKMAQIGRYDFDDMILMSIEALKKHSDFKYTLQEQYQYILLDEYQDTNYAQAELVSLLCDNPVNEGQPNVMAVGDDDQAIYSFQGASHSHMLSFISAYKNVKLITLDINYRSNQSIIDLSTAVAKQIETRLNNQITGINKSFKSGNLTKGKITTINNIDQASEFSFIADNIKKDVKDGNYSNFAVLSPRHKYLTSLAVYLQSKNIPINYERKEDVLSDPLIVQLNTIARLLVAISGNNMQQVSFLLSQVLHYDFWQLDTLDIAKLSLKAYKDNSDWLCLMLKDNKFSRIALYLIKLSSESLSQRFDAVLDQIIGLSETTFKDNKMRSFNSPFYEFYKDDQKLTLRTFSSLIIIRGEFLDYSRDIHGPLLLSDYLSFIDNYISSDLTLINSSPYIESEQSVQLMTAYSAKGREFDSVYLLSANDEIWGPSTRSRSSYISLPPNLTYIRNAAIDNDDEKLRLLYVALTRVKNNLYISSFSKSERSKDTKPLKFFSENNTARLLNSKLAKVNKTKANVLTRNLTTYYSSSYNQVQQNASFKETIKDRLENYKLSPTDLNTFIDVRNAGPGIFFNKVILKYPSPDTPALGYGSAIHKSLEFLQRQLSASKKIPPLERVVKEFIKELKGKHLTNNEFDDYVEKGSSSLKLYFKQNKASLNPYDLSEVRFSNEGVIISGAQLNGNIDKLVINKESKTATIVDYKTGKPHTSWARNEPIHLNQNQLYFYKILLNNSKTFSGYDAPLAYLQYINPADNGKDNRLNLTFSIERQKEIESLIAAVFKHINELDFPDISKYSQDIYGVIEFENDLINKKI